MFHAISLCPLRASLAQLTLPARAGTLLASLAAATALTAAAIAIPRHDAGPATEAAISATQPAATLVLAQGAALPRLDDAAETIRARLLSISGVGAVSLRGLQTAGLEVHYAPANLARLGVRETELQAAVPMQPGGAHRGSIVVQPDAAGAGVGAIANLPVTAGPHVMRLGDMAAVARVMLPAPVSTLRRDGQPAVDIMVTPALGANTRELGRSVAASLAAASLPAEVRMR